MKSSKLKVLLTAFLATLSLILGFEKAQAQVIDIGAILPLTGDGAKYGEEARNGMDLALDGSSTVNVRVIYEDDQGTSAGAISAFNKLADINKVRVILGPMYSSTALAVAPLAARKRVVLLSPSASSPALTTAGDHFFRNWPSDVFEGGEMARYARKKLGIRRAAVLALNLDYGVGLTDVFRKDFEIGGGTITTVEFYDQGATDFRTQLAKIAATKPEVIYLPGYYAEIGLALRQARELGVRSRFLSSVGVDNPKLLEIAGNAAEGLIFARPYYDPESSDPVVKNFVARFTKKFGKRPGVFAAHAYDATHILQMTLERYGSSEEAIKRGLYATKAFPGVTGLTTFDSNGDVIKPILIMKVENGIFRQAH